jgi:hypothetical protein
LDCGGVRFTLDKMVVLFCEIMPQFF